MSLGLKHQPIAGRILEYYEDHPLPPLLIFAGPKGTGKLEAAYRFVQVQLCDAGTGCGNCSNCRLLMNGGDEQHPDFIVFPADRVHIGRVEHPEQFTVRWLLQTRIPFAPYHARRRFVLFPAAELILNEAETALLKTLEEPPDHTRFVFLTDSVESLKETILSRGVMVPFRNVPLKVMEELSGLTDVEDLELLGGSFQFLDLLRSEVYGALKSRVDDALSHQMGLLELETWARDERARSSEMADLHYSYEEFLQTFSLVLLQKMRKRDDSGAAAGLVIDFLTGIRMQQGGMLPFHLSALFHELNRSLNSVVA